MAENKKSSNTKSSVNQSNKKVSNNGVKKTTNKVTQPAKKTGSQATTSKKSATSQAKKSTPNQAKKTTVSKTTNKTVTNKTTNQTKKTPNTTKKVEKPVVKEIEVKQDEIKTDISLEKNDNNSDSKRVEAILNELLDIDDEQVTSKTIELKEILNNIFDRDIRETEKKEPIFRKKINLRNRIFVNFFLFPFILLMISDMFFKFNEFNFNTGLHSYNFFSDTFLTIFSHFSAFLFIYLLFIVLHLFIFSLFNNAKRSKLFLGFITLLLTIINDVKVLIMNAPLHFSDVNFLNASNGDMAISFLSEVSGTWIFIIALKAIIYIGIILLFVLYDRKHPYKFKKRNFMVSIVSFLIIMFPFAFIDKIDSFVLKNIYHTNYDQIIEINDNIYNYYNYGLFQGVYYDYAVSHYAPESSMDEAYIKNKVSMLASEVNLNKYGKPNVVFILSESLSDLERIAGDDITFDKELMSNIRRYQNEGDKLVLDLLVTPYGGSSVNTEFQILTGGNLNFLPTDYIAYTQLYNDNNSDKIPNMIKEFNNNGYITKYITPWSPDSYKSGYVYDLFGIDEKIYGKDMKDAYIKGDYVSDEYLTDYIINELKEDNLESKFLFVATGQNHMPCSANRYDNYDINVVSSKFNEENTNLLRCYAQGVYDADKQLNRLYEEIQKLDEPTIVVLYGDHLPYIVNREAKNIYFNFNYFKEANNLDYAIRTHTTPAVMLSNYGVDFGDISFMDSSYLGAYVLNRLDLEISDYFKYIYYNATTIPVFDRNYLMVNNEFIKINNLDEKDRSNHTFYRNAQQYYFNNYR